MITFAGPTGQNSDPFSSTSKVNWNGRKNYHGMFILRIKHKTHIHQTLPHTTYFALSQNSIFPALVRKYLGFYFKDLYAACREDFNHEWMHSKLRIVSSKYQKERSPLIKLILIFLTCDSASFRFWNVFSSMSSSSEAPTVLCCCNAMCSDV